ncbi:MAG TPA: GNAT family N-acetyltransferase [Pyrinomonadaceae bacterium]
MRKQNSSAIPKTSSPQDSAGQLIQVIELDASYEQEVLEFLSQRPIHTVGMVRFIQDNGIVSQLNRGTFYGCRNREGQLEGVALIGHSTLLETTTDRAAEALAAVAQTCTTAHMITGEKERINNFWHYYAEAGQGMRHARRELLFELKWPVEALPDVPDLRLATSAADLELVAKIPAEVAFYESALLGNAESSRQRCARRIEQGRTWVCADAGKIVFKADVTSYASSVIYLESVWTNSDRCSQGYGLRCMSQLARTLLRRTNSVCVLINENDKKAHRFYQRAGYKLRAIYDTIFLN